MELACKRFIHCLLWHLLPCSFHYKDSLIKQAKQVDPKFSKFSWQRGYGIFSVNPKEADVVKRYIENQDKHHKKMTFKDEFRKFLKNYNIDYDERYIWD
ncbi:transposase [Marinilabilia salmonicolor]|uniref:transposase n=1 Tax=Marinilabilia salmonicolor TaxID=989 RepID=UPI00029B1DCE|nr:transposase [Marinilabilia salmonicolor]